MARRAYYVCKQAWHPLINSICLSIRAGRWATPPVISYHLAGIFRPVHTRSQIFNNELFKGILEVQNSSVQNMLFLQFTALSESGESEDIHKGVVLVLLLLVNNEAQVWSHLNHIDRGKNIHIR